jgi:hypothetical protein
MIPWKIRARLFRWQVYLRRVSPTVKWLSIITLLTFFWFCSYWWRHGMNAALPIIADGTPFFLAVAGIIMSYIPPKRESHIVTSFVLIFIGVTGVVALHVLRDKADADHQKEVDTLQGKMDAVHSQNTELISALIQIPSTDRISEVERKKQLLRLLTNDYILSTNPVDPEILAGNKLPPQGWLNAKLREKGEKWSVADVVKPSSPQPQVVQEILPEEKKASVVFSLYEPDLTQGPKITDIQSLENNEALFSISAIVQGATAEDLHIWIRRCDKCTWSSTNPPGFISPDADHEFDRITSIPVMEPNIGFGHWDFHVHMTSRYPKVSTMGISCYYACKNCDPVNWRKPQTLYVTNNLRDGFRLLAPSISYTPASGH